MILRLKAGVLSFTIYVSIVVSVMLLTMILYGYYARTETAMYKIGIRLLDNLSSAEQWALDGGHEINPGETKTWDLYGDGIDTVAVTRIPWGLFDLYHCQANYQRFHQASYFIAGDRLDSIGQSAVYLVDDGRPLSVVGDTEIKGTAYLPRAGVKSAFINRMGYTRRELIFGDERKSESKVPELKAKEAWEDFEQYAKKTDTKDVDLEGVLSQKFSSDSLLHLTLDNAELEDSVYGFVYLEVDSTVFINESSYTDNIVVSANQIIFEEDFVGSGQFYARDTIIVNEDVILEYPTVLYVSNDRETALIEIKEGAEVNGVVILNGGESTDRDRVVKIENEAKVNGAIYCHGYLESFGEVHGHATTKRFLINSFSGIYENYVLNADYHYDLDSNYLMPNAWFQAEKRGILQWLD